MWLVIAKKYQALISLIHTQRMIFCEEFLLTSAALLGNRLQLLSAVIFLNCFKDTDHITKHSLYFSRVTILIAIFFTEEGRLWGILVNLAVNCTNWWQSERKFTNTCIMRRSDEEPPPEYSCFHNQEQIPYHTSWTGLFL